MKILLNDCGNDYDALIEESRKSTMQVKRLRTLKIEIFMTINNINPEFIKDVFKSKRNVKKKTI